MMKRVLEAPYKTAPIKCWDKAKELRQKHYDNYGKMQEKAGIRWSGSAWAFSAIPAGLGDDVYGLAGEPYAASIASNPQQSLEFMAAVEAKGFARDLCSYMRNYWGSVMLNKYAFGGPFPKPDFIWQTHICCSHAKWYQVVSELEGGTPMYAVDVSVGPASEVTPSRLNYIVRQLDEGIKWMEKVTGRKYDDGRLIKAVETECRVTSLWAEICAMNKAIPAPLDEKTMLSLYVLAAIEKHNPEVADFYEVLRDEVKWRVENHIAAEPNERCRLMTDQTPPWALLKIFRYFQKYGAVSVGSAYTFGLIGAWETRPDGTLGPRTPPSEKGIEIKDREQALRTIAEWTLWRPKWQQYFNPHIKSKFMIQVAKEWSVDGVVMHYNRGCEGSSIGVAENRLALLEAGLPVTTYEANCADIRDCDEAKIVGRIDAFMESLGLRKVAA